MYICLDKSTTLLTLHLIWHIRIVQPAWRACLADYIFCLGFFFIFYIFFFIFFNGRPRSKTISGTTERIFTKISGLVELCKGLINPAFIWGSLKGHCHGNQSVAKSAFSRENFLYRAAIPKRIVILECQWTA